MITACRYTLDDRSSPYFWGALLGFSCELERAGELAKGGVVAIVADTVGKLHALPLDQVELDSAVISGVTAGRNAPPEYTHADRVRGGEL
jgi:hypothetical protein